MQYLAPSPFLELPSLPLLDVRSPAEYQKGHIPGAVNLPIFSNEERAAVGTIYKQQGRTEAVQKGLELVGPKLTKFSEEALRIGKDKQLRVYCWRGGMRSAKMAALFETLGLNCTVLEGGYKAFRQQLQHDFSALQHLTVLAGPTGSGKTAILHELQQIGEQIIDLEGIANHRGSSFGGIGLGEQPSTQQFQNLLHLETSRLNANQRIWVESESFTIGRVHLPENLWQQMNAAPVYVLEMAPELRVKRLLEDYKHLSPQEAREAIERLREQFGNGNTVQALKLLESGEIEALAAFLLQYYDRKYRHGRAKFKSRKPVILACPGSNPAQIARQLVDLAHSPRTQQTPANT